MRRMLVTTAAAAMIVALAACATPADPGSTTAPASPTSEAPTTPASPTPTPTSPSDAGAPTPIPDSELSGLDGFGIVEQEGAGVLWRTPGEELAVFVGGSGSTACVPTPVSATGDGTAIDVLFAPVADETIACTADYRVYGWTFDVEPAVAAGDTVTVRIEGLRPAGEVIELELAPSAALP